MDIGRMQERQMHLAVKTRWLRFARAAQDREDNEQQARGGEGLVTPAIHERVRDARAASVAASREISTATVSERDPWSGRGWPLPDGRGTDERDESPQ